MFVHKICVNRTFGAKSRGSGFNSVSKMCEKDVNVCGYFQIVSSCFFGSGVQL